MIDQDSAVLMGLRDTRVDLRNLHNQIYTENEIMFITCPVIGHNIHEHVERVIRSVQELL